MQLLKALSQIQNNVCVIKYSITLIHFYHFIAFFLIWWLVNICQTSWPSSFKIHYMRQIMSTVQPTVKTASRVWTYNLCMPGEKRRALFWRSGTDSVRQTEIGGSQHTSSTEEQWIIIFASTSRTMEHRLQTHLFSLTLKTSDEHHQE